MAKELPVKVRLKADTKDAETGLNRFQKRLRSLRSAFTKVSVVGTAYAAVIGAINLALDKAAEASSVQEIAVTKLDSALSRSIPGAEDYKQAYLDQATALQKFGQAGDEALIATQALLVEFGVAPRQIEQATQASLDLAAAMGITLESAARNVGKTVGGFAGELGELIPELKDLSAESLKAGAGIDLLAEKFRGSAADAADLYANALNRVNSAQGDVVEGIGRNITQSDRVAKAVRVQALAYEKLSSELVSSEGFISVFKSGILDLETALVIAAIGINRLGGSAVDVSGQMDAAATSTRNMVSEAARLQDIAVPAAKSEKELADAAAQAAIDLREARDAAIELTEAQAALVESANKVTQALGESTSADLVRQMGDIIEGLTAQKQILGETSEEYIRLELVAREKLESLEDRVKSLQSGLGDLTDGVVQVGDAYVGTAERSQALIDANRGLQDSSQQLSQEFASTRREIDSLGRAADTLAGQYDGAARSAVRFSNTTGGGGATTGGGGAVSTQQPLFNNVPSGGAFRSRGSGTRVFVIPVLGGGSRGTNT